MIEDAVASALSKVVLRRIEVTDDTIALDLMLKVGPGGDYLGEEHTIQYMRTEFAESSVSSREHRESWEAGGGEGHRCHGPGIGSAITAAASGPEN